MPFYLFSRYSRMDAAAFLPEPMARMTVAEPVTASPPANTPLRLVAVVSSAMMQPCLSESRPSVVERIRGLGRVPRAMMTVSHSMINSLPAFATGRRRPDSSGSPSSISMHSSPQAEPFSSPSTRWGCRAA